MTYTLAQAAAIFGKLDEVPEGDMPSLDKALRNLSQRYYLPPAAMEGRASVYSLETIIALRLIYQAVSFGLPRYMIEDYARFLQNQHPNGRRVKGQGGSRAMSPVEEAVERAREGEEFSFHIAMMGNGQVRPSAEWKPATSDRVERALKLAREAEAPEVGRFTAPASAQIAALLAATES